MPDAAAGLALQAEQRLREQVVARPVPAVPVVGRRGGREIGVAQLLVGARDGPDVAGAGVLPRPVFPRVVPELARLGDGVEAPFQAPGDGVVAPDVAGRLVAAVELIDGEDADDNRVAADQRGQRSSGTPRGGERRRSGRPCRRPRTHGAGRRCARRAPRAARRSRRRPARRPVPDRASSRRRASVRPAAARRRPRARGTPRASRPVAGSMAAAWPRFVLMKSCSPTISGVVSSIGLNCTSGSASASSWSTERQRQATWMSPTLPPSIWFERGVLRAARLAGVAAPFAPRRALLRRGRSREQKGAEEAAGGRTHWLAADGGSANVTSMLLPIGASSSAA